MRARVKELAPKQTIVLSLTKSEAGFLMALADAVKWYKDDESESNAGGKLAERLYEVLAEVGASFPAVDIFDSGSLEALR